MYSAEVKLEDLPCGGCVSCTKKSKAWGTFSLEVDNVVPLSSTNDTDRVKLNDLFNRRVSTCGMKGSKLIKEPHTDGLNAIAGTECWFWAYTPKQLEQFQRKDQDLALLHIWSDDNARPSRDEAPSLKPALRRYWINWENIVKEEGVLYQK